MSTPSNPLSHVGQTARPETAAQPSRDDGAGDAGAEERLQNQHDEPAGTLEQHPRTISPPPEGTPPSGPRSTGKALPDLEAGEAPPESSAGS